MPKKMTTYQVSVAAESFAAALFARAGFHVSVQYGANQPGYDLIVEREKAPHLVSVKGSQNGKWGLTQSYLQNANYLGAIDEWRRRHGDNIILCFVQFEDKNVEDMPDVYLATSREVASHLKESAGGCGGTILHVNKIWKTGKHAGCTTKIPPTWRFSRQRVDELLK